MDFNEVDPLDSDRSCSESSDVKFSLSHVKVCMLFILYLSTVALSGYNFILFIFSAIETERK